MTAAAQRITASVGRLRAAGAAAPEIAIVLGSGWDGIAATVEQAVEIAYRELPPGATMLVSDHLNLAQRSPLLGERGDDRFVDMVDAYSPVLRAQARTAAAAAGLELHEGVYAWMLGPQFETPAEVRMLRLLGARAVGMSTVPETIVARHAGLRVIALSLITNLAAGLGAERPSHARTLAAARALAQTAVRLLAAIVPALR